MIPGLVVLLGASPMTGKGPKISHIEDSLESDSESQILLSRDKSILCIQLDGKVIGWCDAKLAKQIGSVLRDWKVKKMHGVPLELEIGYVPPSTGGQYPGLFLFSAPARMMRPCTYLLTGTTDMIGPFEQVYMDIACMNGDIVPGLSTHQDCNPTDMLSVIASLTPFSDFNQSPRNMYQCQMGKQSMGTPAQNIFHRTDNKLYRLQTGQTPVVRPKAHEDFGIDGYPNGMNAVVCVISYTGYDMEDASIIAKSSHERGYGYGTVYKGEWVDLSSYRRVGEPITHHFGFKTSEDGDDVLSRLQMKEFEGVLPFLDYDGLPKVGVRLSSGDPYYAYCDDVSGKVKIVRFKGMEDAYIDQVRLIGNIFILI
jgi:DNA-directed RNA polymerase I subunit RPA2